MTTADVASQHPQNTYALVASQLDALLSEATTPEATKVRQLAEALKAELSGLSVERGLVIADRLNAELAAAKPTHQSNAVLADGLFSGNGAPNPRPESIDSHATSELGPKGNKMEAHVVDVGDERGIRLLLDGTALAAWELLRCFGGTLSASAIGRSIHGESSDVERALVHLQEEGIIRCYPIRGRRRRPEYSCLKAGLVIEYRPNDSSDQKAMLKALSLIGSFGQSVALRAQSIAEEASAPSSNRKNFRFSTHLSPHDAKELASRVDELHALMLLLEARSAGEESLDTALCNYQVDIRMSPLVEMLPASPMVTIRPQGAATKAEFCGGSEELAMLSSREHEVAVGLLNRRSRGEIAESLGITISTVATLAKRLYKKLGVHSRDELVAHINGQQKPR